MSSSVQSALCLLQDKKQPTAVGHRRVLTTGFLEGSKAKVHKPIKLRRHTPREASPSLKGTALSW